ncbi:hypothetical protein GCM10010869_05750 [Mesorhizobium tianshanense]|uniref:Alpha-D-ribose 1-methylphosphonate 5-triphosphate synthase subunit PhnG n=1 Tax=Mesorhizobium tianshanense TaxID=39844 RepID=A0A562NLY5_9HYPH|nr:phosphonate C-P lyase system protein PhnG [Mesorhizobium tianshanense]TWI33143.1 alpha-D-ribose 1-methylphosphonate 5-triphosphate synthase subunit PhnG [Mesorhizobium tianshanense]GLS34987.1 hypothetical protein GCM10010869_05750 [Mesorhizobium tianshanense]
MAQEATGDPVITHYTHKQALEILAACRPDAIKALAERLLDDIGEVTVISNRTGLATLPYQDTVKGTAFHLGEVLVAAAHVRLCDHDMEGYGAVVGRDLEHAMAMAVTDAAIAGGHRCNVISEFLDAEQRHQEETDRERL